MGHTLISSLNAGIAQRLADTLGPEDERTPDAPSVHQIGGHARRRDHLIVLDGQAGSPQFLGMLSRRIGAAIGQQRERHAALAQLREYLDRAG